MPGEHLVGVSAAEADVEAGRQLLVRIGGDEREQETVLVADEVAAVGLERGTESEVLL